MNTCSPRNDKSLSALLGRKLSLLTMSYVNFTIDYIDKAKLIDALNQLLGLGKYGSPVSVP